MRLLETWPDAPGRVIEQTEVPSPPAGTCPACGARMPGPDPPDWCPACAWRELVEEERGRAEPAEDGMLFAVEGHDILAEIARGGGGIVYRARQHEPRREVALKMLPPEQVNSAERRARFRAEAELVAGLDHPAILPVYAAGTYHNIPYFTMKLAEGGTLSSRRETLRGDWRAIAELTAVVADAVQFAHAHGVIHRDLKPGNVLFDDAGRPYVSDFGMAKFTNTELRLTGSLAMLGTPAYVAPEVAQQGARAATTASDVYGLGTILYELLTGHPPFEAPSLPLLVRRVIEQPPPDPRRLAPGIPRDLAIICLRCLAKGPDRRFATASALAEDLRRWLQGRPIASRAASPGERILRWARRNPSTTIFSLALAATVLTAAGALFEQNVDLRRTLKRATSAERRAREQLQASLVSEARLVRETARAGARAAALETLERAAKIRSTPELRTEWVAALARPDLVAESVIPVTLPARNGLISFAEDFASFLVPDSEAGFEQREVATQAVLRRFRSGRKVPALYLRFALGDRAIVATYLDRSTEVWDSREGAPWWTFEGDKVPEIVHGGYARREPLITLHPTGAGLAYVAADRSVRWVDRPGGSERIVLPPAGNILELSFSPAGDVLLVVQSTLAAAHAWPGGERLWQHGGMFSPCRAAWQPDGRRVAIGLDGRNDVLLCDAATGRAEEFLSGHTMHPRILKFDRDGRRLFSVAWDGLLVAWRSDSGTLEFTTTAYPSALDLSGDGRRVAVGRTRMEVVIATLEPGECFDEFTGGDSTNQFTMDLAASPDGRWLASVDQFGLRFWDVARARLAWQEAGWLGPRATVRFDADGKSVIQSGLETGVVSRAIELDTGSSTVRLGVAVPFAPGRPVLPRADRAAEAGWSERAGLRKWFGGRRIAAGRVAALALENRARARISPDKSLLALVDDDAGVVTIRAVGTGRRITALPSRGPAVIGFSPDGRWLLVGGEEEYQLWEVGTWRRGPSWPAVEGNFSRGAFDYSPDGGLVAVRQGEGVLELRETARYAPVLRLEPPIALRVEHIEWSPDGGSIFLLCTGHRVVRWDLFGLRRELGRHGSDW